MHSTMQKSQDIQLLFHHQMLQGFYIWVICLTTQYRMRLLDIREWADLIHFGFQGWIMLGLLRKIKLRECWLMKELLKRKLGMMSFWEELGNGRKNMAGWLQSNLENWEFRWTGQERDLPWMKGFRKL